MTEPRATPPPWLNRLMTWMLRTPVLQRIVGRGTALLTFTGRRSGRTYTTPISYARVGDRIVMTAHESRQWWRHLQGHPQVVLGLAGREMGADTVVRHGTEAVDDLVAFFGDQPLLARAAGIGREDDGRPRRADVAVEAATTVVVVAEPWSGPTRPAARPHGPMVVRRLAGGTRWQPRSIRCRPATPTAVPLSPENRVTLR